MVGLHMPRQCASVAIEYTIAQPSAMQNSYEIVERSGICVV